MDSMEARKRRRPALACAECRRQKVKCDRKVPCSHCTRYKSATCTYVPNPAPSIRSPCRMHLTDSSAASSTIGRLQTPDTQPVERFNSLTDHFPTAENSVPLVNRRYENRMATYTDETDNRYSESTIGALTDRLHEMEQELLKTTKSSSNVVENHSPAQKTNRISSKGIFSGPSHWIHSVEPVRYFS